MQGIYEKDSRPGHHPQDTNAFNQPIKENGPHFAGGFMVDPRRLGRSSLAVAGLH